MPPPPTRLDLPPSAAFEAVQGFEKEGLLSEMNKPARQTTIIV
jgi:hypothetical protein